MPRPVPLRVAVLAAGVLAVAALAPGRADPPPLAVKAPAAVPGKAPTRRALLVGVTKYPSLSARQQLEGPGNDVKLMRTVLTTQFGVPDANLSTLSEADGAAAPDRLPTRANIEREFKRLAAEAKPGEEVVILLGGHGSQQPEDPKAADPEPDGLDEIFLPRDVGPWSDTVGAVENAITDNQLGEWVKAIRDKQAFVWLVLDSCHSGTMMRAVGNETPRKLDFDDLGVPRAKVAAAERAAAARPGGEKTRGGGPAEPTAVGFRGQPGVVAIYAAQPTETTPERPMPPGGEAQTQHGVLTFTICQVLTQAKAAGSPVSYRELARRIQDQYTGWGRTSPTPMVEFPDTDPDREVLGPGTFGGRSKVRLARAGDKYKIDAGQLLGLTPGSILEVRPPAGTGDQVLGHVRVGEPKPLEADVTPCEYATLPAPKELPDGARCKVVFVDYGEVQLPVGVATHYPSVEKDLKPVPAAVRDALVKRLRAAAGPDALFRAVDKDPAWLLAPAPDGRVALMPAAGWSPTADPVRDKGYGPVPLDDGFATWLGDAFGRIARADGLVKLAGQRTDALTEDDVSTPRFKVELSLRGPAGKPPTPVAFPAPGLTMFDGDKPQIKVTNAGRVAFDVTVLYVASDRSIGVLFPKGNTDNTLRAGQSIPVGGNISGDTVGDEQVVLIAVKSDGPARRFTDLAQKGPERMRGEAARGKASGLTKMLERQVFKVGARESTRGLANEEAVDHTMGLITWQVKGTPRPTPGK